MSEGYDDDGVVDGRPYVIERPGPKGRIRLGPIAKEMAAMHGMTITELARYLLAQDQRNGES